MEPLSSALLFGLLVGFGVLMLVLHLALHAIAYRPLQKAAERGELRPDQGEQVFDFTANAFGQNPDIRYRYSTYVIPPGEALILRGRVHPDAWYTSLGVYDPLLQTVLPERSAGPTMLNQKQLHLDADGRYVVVLSRQDPGDVDWLDCSGAPRGVLFERHIGAFPDEHTALQRCPVAEVAARLRQGA